MKHIQTIRRIAAILFLLSLFCTVDLGLNLLYNTEPLQHDGSFGVRSLLHAMFGIFGDRLWSFDRFFRAFEMAAWCSFVLLAGNVLLHFIKEKE